MEATSRSLSSPSLYSTTRIFGLLAASGCTGSSNPGGVPGSAWRVLNMAAQRKRAVRDLKARVRSNSSTRAKAVAFEDARHCFLRQSADFHADAEPVAAYCDSSNRTG